MNLRVVSLPNELGIPWDDLQWDGKAPGDNLDFIIDAAKWLRDAGRSLLSADVFAPAGALAIMDVQLAALSLGKLDQVIIHIAGGAPDTIVPVYVSLSLDGGRSLNFTVTLPIGPGMPSGLAPFAAPGAQTIGNQLVTIGGKPIII